MKKKIKGYISALAVTAFVVGNSGVQAETVPAWAADGVAYCQQHQIIQGYANGELGVEKNITRAEMAKMLSVSFGLSAAGAMRFTDVPAGNWAYPYINAFQDCVKKAGTVFGADELVTREEFTAALVLAAGLNENSLWNPEILAYNYDDAGQVDPDYQKLLAVAVERGYLMGAEQQLSPKQLLTRAQVCTLLQRVLEGRAGNIELELGVRQSSTSILGAAQVSVEQAQRWAQAKGAEQRFVDIAPVYWNYGELTGVRPEVLYAQAAKETGFGRYGGAVLPEMNNWAGIKVKSPEGDRTEDHETFATPDDGVRAHFNHMGAYIGLAPVGEPHDRYYVVKSIDWAGSIKTVEQLGGKWCPDLYYGYSILHNYIEPMMKA